MPPRGVLHRLPDANAFSRSRYAPGAALAGIVAYFWSLRWDLRGRPTSVQETLPHSNIYLVFEEGDATIAGVHTARMTRTLSGLGRVFGVKFRPGGFRPFVDQPVATLADSARPANHVFGDSALSLGCDIHDIDDDAERVEAVARFLIARLPKIDASELAAIERAATIVGDIKRDHDITRVEDLVRGHAIGKRAVQRLFHEYVGATPKWVINRYRLHAAVERLQGGACIDWTVLALDLGYFDQAHFIGDFRHLTGCTPADYARRMTAEGSATTGV